MEKSNLLLAALSPGDRALIEPRLKPVHLEQGHVIYSPGDTVNAVYFPLSAIISLVVELSDGGMIEAAMVGRDGVVGATSALDGRISLSRAIVQIGGDAMVCDVHRFQGRGAAEREPVVAGHAPRADGLWAGPAIGGLQCVASRRSAAVPLDAAGARSLRVGRAAVHPGIPRRNAGRAAHQCFGGRAHAAVGRDSSNTSAAGFRSSMSTASNRRPASATGR